METVLAFVLCHRKADGIFGDLDIWRNVIDKERRDVFDDVVHLVAKREKVGRPKITNFVCLFYEACCSVFIGMDVIAYVSVVF